MAEEQPLPSSKQSNNPQQIESNSNIETTDSPSHSMSQSETNIDQNHDSKRTHNESSDDNKSNNNNSSEWNCPSCTFSNQHNGTLCSMCDQSRYNYATIEEKSWNNALLLNKNNLTEVPQWIKCNSCNKWRNIQIPISTIKTWEPPSNYTCSQSNGEFICNQPSRIPSAETHSQYELFVLGTQRCLAQLKAKITLENITQLNDLMLKQKQDNLPRKTQLEKANTIIIDDENEIESENDIEKSASPGWNCIQCTFKNQHLGNLCAMCDTAKPGSTVTKISDEQYAQLLHKSFEEGRDVSITPDIERIAIGSGPVQGGNNNNNNNNNNIESSPDLLGDNNDKRAMSVDSIGNGNNNNKRIPNLPPNAEIGPFGAITCVHNGHRSYLTRDNNNINTLKWVNTPPKFPQSWVREIFGNKLDTLPKMNEVARRQIEQLNEQGHYFDNPIALDNYTFNDDKIDLTTTDNDNSSDDIEIISEKKDLEYAKKLQALFNDENKVQKVQKVPIKQLPIHNGYINFENYHRKNSKKEEDSMDFDFSYDGMHAKDTEPVMVLPDGNIGIHHVDNSDQSVAQMLNMGLRQENVEPINNINGMSIELFDHQKKGVAWMLQMENDRKCKGGFLCDQMGVGKTIQIIALMLKGRKKMHAEAEKKYKEDGYISESDYEDSVDSQDDTCGGFIVGDDEIDFQSDDNNDKNTNNNNNNNNNSNEVDDDDWFPGMEQDNNDNKNDEDNNNDDGWLPGMEQDNSNNKPLKKRGKKRKYSDLDDSEATIDEEDEITCLNDLNRNRNRNNNNNNNSNNNNNNRDNSLGSDSPFVLHDDDIESESSIDLVDGLLNRMKNKKKKKKNNKKKLDDYYDSHEPIRKRRKLNNNNNRNNNRNKNQRRKKIKKKKKKKQKGNALYDEWLAENGFSAKKRGKRKPWKDLKQRTLIVGPLAIIDQWAEEIADKAPRKFKVCVYHGGGRKKKYNKYSLKKYDVVITTFGHVTSEYQKGNEEKQDGLFKLPNGFFHRVVLDEAHTIKNPSSQQSKACACIGNRGVKVRWCLTGTPIQNRLLDLFPLCRFLQIKQCGTAKDFKQFLKLGNDKKQVVRGKSKQLVTSFLAAHMLRRLKDEVVDDLVSKTEEVIELEFDEAEDHVYKAFQNHARSRFNKFVQAGTAKKNYAHILVLLLRLRQICDHPFLAMKVQDGRSESVGDQEDGSGSDSDGMDMDDSKDSDPLAKIDKKIVKRLNDLDNCILDSECPICLDIFTDGIMFPNCGHLVCKEHLYDLDEKCPICRNVFRVNRVISFNKIIKSSLIDEKHKNSLLSNDGKDGLIMDGNVVSQQMGNVSSEKKGILKAAKRRIVWRKVSAAKGIFRSVEQIEEEEEKKEDNNNNNSEDVKDKLKKMQEKFDWNTYICDEKFNAEFDDDDENGYVDSDKYPNEEYGWQFIPSSKTKMMMQKILSIRRNKPNDKIIVFSQFTTMLSILERVLRKYKINYLMYDGSKTRQQRKDIINDFKKDEYNDIPVMLMSLKCAALGLNLTIANHVIFCDLWWNPAIESQAIDRVHRIGQEKHVFITRMIIKTSVEERILALQRDKQKIADSILDGANFIKRNGLSVQDLAMLFGSDENIMEMARQNDTGFSRDTLMNVRRRPDVNMNNNNMHNHNHHNNNHNVHHHRHNMHHNNHPMSQHYFSSLDADTRALIARLQNE